jgi:serine phosphatase RsbU (regulator of sigma subunit)
LIVDDTPANLRLLASLLSRQGYRVRPVPSGTLALVAIQQNLPDLILLDIRMPELDGYEVSQRLKADSRTRDIPIIFISALDATEDKVRAFTVGGVDYVSKPFQADEVLARVKTHLALRNAQIKLQEANAEMEQALAFAGKVQNSFLSHRLPEIAGWDLSVVLQPVHHTSGDFFDLHILPDGRVGILIADVVDKGVGAALFMALCWAHVRTYASIYPSQPEEVLGAVNRRIMADTDAKQFATMFYGVLDPQDGRLVYANAGHLPPILHYANESAELGKLVRTGRPLCMFENEGWGQDIVQLDPGSLLLLYTDGITETQDGNGEFYGEERLIAFLEQQTGAVAQDVLRLLLRDLDSFREGAPQMDDIALVVIQCKTED